MLIGGILVFSVALAVLACLLSGAFAGVAWLWILPVGFVGSAILLTVIAFLFLWVMCALVRQNVPQEKDSPFYRQMAYLYIDAIMKVARVHVHTEGVEKIPREGRFVLACNHVCDADPAILLSVFKESQLAFISKQENSSMFIVGKLMHKIMCQLINRENDREALKTILKCIQLIKEDAVSIGIFPEGYIHEDRKLHRFRHGVFKIAQKANVPVVVCTLKDTQHVFHNAFRLKRSDVYLSLIEVIPAEEVTGCTAVELSERVYNLMARDLGPERVHHGSGENA